MRNRKVLNVDSLSRKTKKREIKYEKDFSSILRQLKYEELPVAICNLRGTTLGIILTEDIFNMLNELEEIFLGCLDPISIFSIFAIPKKGISKYYKEAEISWFPNIMYYSEDF